MPLLDKMTKSYIDKFIKHGRIKIIKYRNQEVRFYLPNIKPVKGYGDTIQGVILMSDSFYEEALLRKIDQYISTNAVILDIGANIGNHSLYFAKVLGAEVYAFEPVAKTFMILEKNVKINSLENQIHLYNCAIGESNSNASIASFNPNNLGGTALKLSDEGDIKVMSLDSNMSDFPKIDFIKIDTEGFEYQVLLGAINLIRRDRPTIFVEIEPDNYNKIEKLLCSEGFNYRVKDLKLANNYLFLAK